jgi:hypothetical protein
VHMALWSKITSSALVIVIGALTSVLFILNQGSILRQEVEEYPRGSTQIYLYGVPEERAADVLAVLGEFSEDATSAVVRVDHELADVDGTVTGMRVGVATASEAPPSLALSFLGTPLFGTGQIEDLVSADPAASIGLDANAADVIHDVPELVFAPRITVVQLARLVESSGTINGTYRVVGGGEERLTQLASALEPVTGLSSEHMLTPLRGQNTDGGLTAGLLGGFVIAAALLLLLVLVFEAVRAFRVLGVHLLFGRSRWGFAFSLFRPVVVAVVVAAGLSMVLTLAMAPGYELNLTMLGAVWSAATVGALPSLGCLAIAVVALVAIKPVDAILGRFSKRLLLGVLAGFYVVAVAGFTVTFVYLDGPIKEAAALADVRESWSAVADQQILYHTSAGQDQASFTGQSSEYQRDFYEWYSAIADDPGVSLVNTQHFDQSVINAWSGVYASVPEQPFWYVAASPNYLAAQGFTVNADLVARAEAGERVFLIPDTWDDSTQAAMRGWLTEKSDISYEPSIRTAFFDDRIVSFEGYRPAEPLFSWSTDPAGRQGATDAVILVTTPENMVPFESESLVAVGLDNSYVKLDGDAATSYTSPSYLAPFHLDDNQVEFLPVSDFVAGLTKTIQSVLQLFGAVILFLSLFCLIMLVALTKLYSTTYREALAVKRMLGYSFVSIFAPALALIGVVGVVATTTAALSLSKSAVLGNTIMLAAQLIVFVFLACRYSRLQLSTTLNE